MLREHQLFGLVDKVSMALQRIKMRAVDGEPFDLAFSGGKDSCTIERLARIARVPFVSHYNVTNVDPPELCRHIKTKYPEVIWRLPKETMWQLIVRKLMPPTRTVRYCCQNLKEKYIPGQDSIVITGVRRQESVKRSRRAEFYRHGKRWLLNPIIDWTTEDVWEFHKAEGIPYCCLYDEGFRRLGCVCCPNAGWKKMRQEGDRWPRIREAYIRAFDAMIANRNRRGLVTEWKTGIEVFDWWTSRKREMQDPAQGCLAFE